MFRIQWRHLLARPLQLCASIVLLTIILALIPIATNSLSEANEQVKADITDFSRGKYDLLVRSSDAPSSVEESLGVVEENYLGVGDGGIRIEDWQEIATDERIAFAAPVAALGSFTKTSQSFQVPKPGHPVRYTVTHHTSDGQETYKIAEQTAYFLFPLDGDFYDVYYPEELTNIFTSLNPSFVLPSSYHPVVAIDPESESALTGVDFSSLETEISDSMGPGGGEGIPLVGISESRTPIETTIKVEALDVTEDEIDILKQELSIPEGQGLEYVIFDDNETARHTVESNLSSIESVEEEVKVIDFGEHLTSFEQDWYMLDEDYNIIMGNDYDINLHGESAIVSDYTTQNTFYNVSPPAYELQDKTLSVNVIDLNGNIPLHRNVTPIEHQSFKAGETNEDFVYFTQVNTISVGSAENDLAASPLGIYQYHYGTLEETGDELHPTHLAGNYLPTPAHGLVSIEWAERFKGAAPIDAIRVKVDGIDGYTEAAATKIREVASDIEAKGFHVDIVAGSSHQTLAVDVEEIGTVLQPWTTLGAADTIFSSWNVFGFAIGSAFFMIALLALVARFRVMKVEQTTERERFGKIGWSHVTIQRFYRGQWLWQLLVSATISGAYLLLIYGFQPILLISFSGALVTIQGLKWICDRLNDDIKTKKQSFKPQQSLIITNIRYHQSQIIAAALQLLLTTGLLAFIISLSEVTVRRMTETNLGSYIHWQINDQQLLLLTGVIVLTAFTLTESLFRLWQARQQDIHLLYKVGWHDKNIRGLLRKETYSWVGATIFIGMMCGNLFVYASSGFTWKVVIVSCLVSLTAFTFVALLNESVLSRKLFQVRKG
ncbi:hypothetical protein SAMN05216389_11213 [Oceanobacillus limi]|uniref:FtsX-like permease family protein n=1 Tax=Oceanobacillus limi TaxID=930131 RepID=A0A1I0ENC8_9BACI|nr:hypothetical protein [Oceanobacillus limi]SET46871.1 hypothetical protein SAMN05216389_11213 [Oceanobacillus limi]